MPSPVAHSLMGYAIYLLSQMRAAAVKWPRVVIFVLAANIPDIDFLPGIMMGDLRRFHHGISHSIAFSLVFALLVGTFCHMTKMIRFKKGFTLAFVLYFSHIVLDYFVLSPGRGVPFFWPFSDKEFMVDVIIFPTFDYLSHGTVTIFSLHNVHTMIIEALILIPLVVFAYLLKMKKLRQNAQSETDKLSI